MPYAVRKIIFAISIMAILITSVLGQITPASAYELVKRDFSILHDQHLTARTGNTLICGDHMCLPGEWTRLSESLSKAQFSYGHGKNFQNAASSYLPNYNPTYTMPATPSTPQIPTQNYNPTYTMPSPPSSPQPIPTPTPTPPSTPPIPTPIPTPPTVPYSVCQTVNATLTNSTISSSVVAKIMNELGCS
ncbi:MAG: hypothetical protein WBV92_07335 [Nitrosotalea sp.]